MVDVCRATGEASRGPRGGGGARFAKLDVKVDDAARMKFKTGSFDTVVDTFGLCSYEDPVATLREMARVCKSGGISGGDGGGGGRLFLLEHGRSDAHGWLSNILDAHATAHAAKWGCYWNRDIPQIVKDAGLEIIEHRAYHFGTTHYLVAAKPTPPRRRG
jgi:methyltransferase OMS1